MNPEIPRRAVLDFALRAGFTLVAGGMAVPGALYLWPASRQGPGEGPVSAGPADTLAAGSARMVNARGRPVIVLARPDGGYRAFSAICTHLGCVVKWDDATKTILCPCHAGVFGADGRVQSGPPPRPLPEYEVIKSGNELKVKV